MEFSDKEIQPKRPSIFTERVGLPDKKKVEDSINNLKKDYVSKTENDNYIFFEHKKDTAKVASIDKISGEIYEANIK